MTVEEVEYFRNHPDGIGEITAPLTVQKNVPVIRAITRCFIRRFSIGSKKIYSRAMKKPTRLEQLQ